MPAPDFFKYQKDSDLLYLIGTHVPDNIAVVFDGRETTALVSALEITRLMNALKIDTFIARDNVK
jgi:hypothetical protein